MRATVPADRTLLEGMKPGENAVEPIKQEDNVYRVSKLGKRLGLSKRHFVRVSARSRILTLSGSKDDPDPLCLPFDTICRVARSSKSCEVDIYFVSAAAGFPVEYKRLGRYTAVK